jgi:aryl-alcohol dehydrogenase-like predicted oxidoreductase
MKQVALGPLTVSEVAFGCMSLQAGDTHAPRLLQQALNQGITFFDTADLYDRGENEELLGKALGHRRQEYILATKVGNQWRADGSGWDWNPRKEYILKAVEASLRRLRTDYIDLYQLHGGTFDDPIDETIEAFETLRTAGKIRAYGISSIRPNVIREWSARSEMVSVMMQYGLLDRRPEEACLPLLAQKGIGVLARGSLAKGLLAGKPAAPFLGYSSEETRKAAQAVTSLATEQRNAAGIAIRYALQRARVAVVGIRTETQLNDALRAGDTVLASEEITLLDRVLQPETYRDHR